MRTPRTTRRFMARYFCHDHPDTLSLTTEVVDQRPGAVLLREHPFYPGGGGQLADRGILRWEGGRAVVTGFENIGGKTWLTLDAPAEVNGAVEAEVDPAFRQMMRELHTD